MPEGTPLYNSFAPLRNVTAFVDMVQRVENRAIGLPGMATFHGYSGYGKTFAAVYAANRFNALQVQVKESWKGKKLCQSILGEMGIKPDKVIADMIDQIAQELTLSQRVLIIDDAQFLVKSRIVGIVRDIYESSGGTVILVGEEGLPQDLQEWENIHGRMLDWVAALPACLSDIDHLAPIYCPDVSLDDALKQHLLQSSQNSIRRVCINLGKIREFAAVRGVSEVTADAWGNQAFAPCTAPKPRRELA